MRVFGAVWRADPKFPAESAVLAAGACLVLLVGAAGLLLAGERGVGVPVLLTFALAAGLAALAIFPVPSRTRLTEHERLAASAAVGCRRGVVAAARSAGRQGDPLFRE
jgi:hypothetical protein